MKICYYLKRGPARAGMGALVVALVSLLASAPSVASGAFDVTQYAGKVVVLDFWASWCVPCRRSFPWLNAMHDKYAGDGLVIVGVNLDMERAEAEQFLAEYPADFAVVFDEQQQLAREFEVVAMPSSFLIDRDGRVVTSHMGFKVKQQDDYETAIVNALQKSGAGHD